MEKQENKNKMLKMRNVVLCCVYDTNDDTENKTTTPMPNWNECCVLRACLNNHVPNASEVVSIQYVNNGRLPNKIINIDSECTPFDKVSKSQSKLSICNLITISIQWHNSTFIFFIFRFLCARLGE